MKISELKPRQGKVDIVLEVTEILSTREFQKFGESGRVATLAAKDESGIIKLTLWNDEIDKVKVGDRVKISNGYVSEFQGEKQLSAGKFGKLEVVKE